MKINKIVNTTIVLVIFTLFMVGCGTADTVQSVQTERLQQEADAKVGFPTITNFRERRLLKDLYEARDRSDFLTYTYIVNLYGELIWFCDSVGYGVPYSTQFSNPQKRVNGYSIQQPEPNSLFIPEGLSATWVQCFNPKTKQTEPQYVEPEIVVLTYKR